MRNVGGKEIYRPASCWRETKTQQAEAETFSGSGPGRRPPPEAKSLELRADEPGPAAQQA
jgi:hypothetical protein